MDNTEEDFINFTERCLAQSNNGNINEIESKEERVKMTSHDIERLIAIEFWGWQETKSPYLFVGNDGKRIDVRNTFTKDIAFAWQIAERMKDTWSDFAISKEGDAWNVFWGLGGASWENVSADTVEMALCLASLQSIDIDIPSDIEDLRIMFS